jgi:LuxR family maltose regulon positive regulatory protein
LIERLSVGLRRGGKLTLVSAPAGFGKTTLLSEWAASAGRPVAWLSLDEDDNDPARFMSYLVAALHTIGEGLDVDAPGISSSPQPLPIEAALAGWINQINALAIHFTLVLDDYHLITAQPIHNALGYLLDHMPPQMHLAIATRADPPLPVARLRGRGQLTELRQTDLCFTPEEAAAFLRSCMDLELSVDDMAALASRTEGWISGLQMAALSMQGRDDLAGFVAAFTGSNRYVLDYLLEEVLYREPDHVQSFLLQTSILDRLSAPLCDAVVESSESTNQRTGGSLSRSFADAQAVLEYLERANLFVVPLDDRREWYRYHRLFADLLHSRLQQAQPDLAPALHGRASGWYEQHGWMTEAIDHALVAADLEWAADLIEKNAEATMMRGEITTFLRWVEALPDELVRVRPSLCVFHAWVLLLSGRPLAAIESRLHDADTDGEQVSGALAALRALLAAFQGQVSPALALAHQALAQLPQEDRFMRGFVTWIVSALQADAGDGAAYYQAMDELVRTSQRAGNVMMVITVMCNQAELDMRRGHLRKAAATFRQVLELATDGEGQRLPIAGQALVGLGELAREWGDLDAATRYLTEGIELVEQWTEIGPYEAYLSLARVMLAQRDTDGAREAVQKAQELAVKSDVTELDDLVVAMLQARLWIEQGDLDAAQRWAEGRDLIQYIDTALREEGRVSIDHRLHKYELVILARLLFVQGRVSEALRLLTSLLPVAEQRRRTGLIVEIQVLQALAFQAQGDLDRAIAALERAITRAEPVGYVRTFVDEGQPMAQLLEEARRRGIAIEYVGRLLAAFERDGSWLRPEGFQVPDSPVQRPSLKSETLSPEILFEPLSERELQVLRLLSTHLSSTEIAEELVISVNTVRSHIKNIYGKLGVHRRSDAVQRAHELKLL